MGKKVSPIIPAFSITTNNQPEELLEKRVFSDPTIPAGFIATNKPFKIIPHKNLSGQVEFHVEGIGIDEALDELYADVPVGVMTYVRALKGLRSAIFSLKGPKPAVR
jgi:hypothetical protein